MLRFVLISLVAAGCMPKTFQEDALPAYVERPVYATYPFEFNSVWEATLEVVGDAAPLQTFEPDRGYILTNWVSGSSDQIYKNYGGTRIPESVRYRLEVEVVNTGNGTEVKMLNHEQIEKDMISIDAIFTGAVYHWIDIPSSTKKEHALLEQIGALIDQRQGGGNYDLQY